MRHVSLCVRAQLRGTAPQNFDLSGTGTLMGRCAIFYQAQDLMVPSFNITKKNKYVVNLMRYANLFLGRVHYLSMFSTKKKIS